MFLLDHLDLNHKVCVLFLFFKYMYLSCILKWTRLPQGGVAAASKDNSSMQSPISISDVDSTNIHLLQAGHVRDRLARLAALHLKKRKKVWFKFSFIFWSSYKKLEKEINFNEFSSFGFSYTFPTHVSWCPGKQKKLKFSRNYKTRNKVMMNYNLCTALPFTPIYIFPCEICEKC